MKNLINYLSKKSLSLGNGPALDRRWTGHESGRFLSILTLFLTLFSFGVGNAWGALPANPTWTATALDEIADDATVIIISSSGHALPSTTISSSPAKISCTVTTSAGVSTISPASGTLQNLAWTVDKLASSWKFYQEGSNTIHLYLSGTGSNTALRVGSGSSNDQFVMGSGGKLLKVTTANRYVGPYSSGSDWRTYNSETHANYGSASLTFYVLNTGGGSTPVTGVSVSPTSKSIVPGETFTITPTVAPAGASDKSVSWTSSATSKATVNSSGVVTGVAAGTSTITCTTTDGGYTATCAVTVRGVTMQARDEDGNAIGAGGPGAPTRSGTTITAAADAGNYVFKQWDVTNATAASTTTSPTTISNPTGAVTVTAIYYKPITITYKANGSTFTTQTYSYGGTLAFPASNPDGATYSCTGKTFVGWVDEANKDYSHASIAPTYATAGSSVTEAATYYAVFATATPGDDEDVVYSFLTADATTTSTNAGWSITNPTNNYAATYGATWLRNNNASLPIFTFAPSANVSKITLKLRQSNTTGSNTVACSIGGSTIDTKNMPSNSSQFDMEFTPATASNGQIIITCTNTSSSGTGKGSFYVASITLTQAGTTYSNYETNCCTPLGSINGSVSLSTSSTGTSVSVEVLTDGVNAYGDANNVSGYDFNLYTASAGGSAAATYSSDSKAGTSHEFTELTPLTQYWVTVRPIGSGSYCNTTAESDRVAIYTCPGSPNHVDVSGRWDRFGGETISLTAAAYATAGTGTAIPAAKITGYQWQKWYNSQWNNISNAGTTSGATTNNLQITSCSNENSGSYRCVVSTVAGCDIASDGFQVKVYALECYNSGTTVYNFTRTGDTQAGTVQIDLSASTNYGYKVHADNDYYGNSGTVNEDVVNWEMSTGVSNNLTVASGLGGTFTFAIDYSTGGNNSTEGIPEISVTYPRKTIYLTPGVWNTGGAKFAFYYYRDAGSSGWTDFITANDCGSSADIPQWNGVKINAVRLSDECSSPDWSDKWNQTSNITITSNNSVSITGWGPDKGDSPYDYGTYAVPTYTISYAKGSVPTGGGSISGSKADETKTCGVDFTLPAAQFTTTGYVQTGWSKADGGAQYAAVSGSYTDNSAQTFYPVWTANTHTLTWDKNGGDALTGDYTSGTVAYATAITAPNTPTWTGHTFNGWHNGSSIVTPATTMPDNDLTYTAQWSLATYTVTLNTNGGTINSGNVTSYTYGTGATLPTDVTRDGYRFDGWFSDDGVWSDQVTAISTTATGDKTYYAKWTQVYTVTWSVNGETWSSGVVDGNTYVVDGQRVSALPTAPTSSDCDDSKVFVGWRATAIDGTSTSDPGGIFTTQAGSPTIDADKTFYAVFADESGGDNTLVTNVSELTVGTQVYFYAETSDDPAFTAVMKAYESGNNVRAVSGSVSNNKLTPSDGACLYTIGTAVYSETTGYTFNDGTNYLYAASTSANHLKSRAAKEADGWAIFSISITDGVASISSIGNTSRGVLQFNKNNDTGDYTAALFACYASEANTRQNVQIFKKNPLVYANYVTTCSSCDADATFTNEAPEVSEIGCTSATLTMEDGLATLGAAGCNISDYGFVIGTSDNPAIGGSGVTKLQVGTTNPTTGEDFSYDATDLTKGTHYYIRAYAINRHGTAYSTNSQNFWTKDVSSIAITTAPTKTNYIVGETFDATGMVVTATMASGATEDVTSDVTYSTDPLTSGTNKDFAINYTLCETDKSVNQKINVYTLAVSEGDNPSYGSYTVNGAVITVSLEAQKTFSFATTNCSTRDNGNGTYTVINVTGNATVVINYRNAVQVKVYYKVDGTTITSLTQDVYESSQTTLPTASALSSAMAAQGMALPDELYPNFIGWSETEFGAQTADPTIVEGTPIINAEKNYYAVYSNVNKIRIDESDITSTSYPGSEQTLTKSSKDFKYYDICKNSTYYLQFRKTNSSYIYNNTAISNIAKIEVGASDTYDAVAVYAGSAANTISGSSLEDENTSTSKYIYLFPSNTQYFIIKGNSSYTYRVNYIDIYYASSTVYYMTQFCTRYAVTGASTGGTAVIVNGNTGGTLTSSHNELCEGKSLTLSATVNTQYSFGEWKIVKTGVEPEVDLTNTLLGANKTSLTPPAFAMPGYGITVSATISEKTATAWSWTYNSAAIPDPMILYVGEIKQLDVTYTPDASQLVSTQKNYSVTKESSPVAEHAKAMNYYKMRGAAGVTEETNATVTFSLNSLTQVVNVTVRPLPSATFEDNVHNAISTTVTATVTDGVVELTKKTPTHADVAAPVGGNECETTHLHLVGWIDGDWEPFINYMNGGSRPSDSDITSATGYFYLPNADIDLSTKDGHTYYAVWGKVDE